MYSKLREKMCAVRSNILMNAAAEYQLHLDPAANFDTYVQQAITIAHRVQTTSPHKREASPAVAEGTDKRKSRRTGQPSKSKFQKQADLSQADLLKEWNRCSKCGWKMGAPGSEDHKCDPTRLDERVAGMRRSLKQDRNPNKRVAFSAASK